MTREEKIHSINEKIALWNCSKNIKAVYIGDIIRHIEQNKFWIKWRWSGSTRYDTRDPKVLKNCIAEVYINFFWKTDKPIHEQTDECINHIFSII